MKNINMADRFGDFCANGEVAIQFLNDDIIPSLKNGEDIFFDFNGVRNMNSSFANALFANLVIKSGVERLKKIKVINCRSNVKILISSAIEMGAQNAFVKV